MKPPAAVATAIARLLASTNGESRWRSIALYRLEGVVLRAADVGEADRLVTVYTPDRGKRRLVAKGARRIRSRLAAGIQPFTRSLFQCWQGRSLDGIRQVQVIEGFRPLRERLEGMAAGLYACELIDALTQDEDANPEVYRLLLQALRALAAAPRLDELDRILLAFQWKALARVGFQPALDGCVVCGEREQATQREVAVSLAEGGVVCPTHRAEAADVRWLPASVVGAVRGLLHAPLRAAANLRLSPSEAGALRGFSRDFLAHLLERRLRSAGFLERLREEQ